MFMKGNVRFETKTSRVLMKVVLMIIIGPVFLLEAFEGFEPSNVTEEFRPEDTCREFRCDNGFIDVDDLPCRCDGICEYYGDCCWDKATFRDTYAVEYPKRELQRCRRPPGIVLNAVESHHIGHFMVSDCPEATNNSLRRACAEEPDTDIFIEASNILPVEDKEGFVYKNIYCALCHGVNETKSKFWEVRHWCKGCPAWIDLFPSYKVKLDDPDCLLVSSFPASPYSSARSCILQLTETCPNDFEDDKDVIEKCKNYIAPVRAPVIVYKNPHCAICNGLDFLNFIELCTNFMLHFDVNIADVFTVPWKLNVDTISTSTTQIPDDDSGPGDISRLSHCTKLFPPDMLFTVVLPNSSNCPFLGKRVENCVLRELQEIELPGSLGQLRWTQVVPLSDTDPTLSPHGLYFSIPDEISSQENWITLVSQLYGFIDSKREVCGFTDTYLLRMCGERSSRDGTLMCDNLFESNASEVLIRVNQDSDAIALHPLTQESLGHVSRFEFTSRFNGSLLKTYHTSVCFKPINSRPTSTPSLTSSKPSDDLNSETSFVERVISSAFISISVLSLLFTFFTYYLFPTLRNTFGLTLMNFVAALAIGQLLIHFVTDYVTQLDVVCQVVAILTHFFWLATFSWMNLLAWDLNSTFRKAKFHVDTISKRKIILNICYGWGFPFLTVTACIVLHFVFNDVIPITYGLVRGVTCWIGNDWVAFVVVGGPLAVVIAMNGVLFSLVVIGMQRSRFRAKEGAASMSRSGVSIQDLLVYVKISLLMGFTWTFGFVASLYETRTLWYIYYALQCFQGILIMAFFCFNKKLRPLWKKKFGITS